MIPNKDQLRQNFPFVASGPFGSHNEMVAAISSPMYSADPAYRAQVEAKLSRTDRAQWGLSEKRPAISYTHAAPPVVDNGHGW